MAKFYVGQPVVCVWEPEKFNTTNPVPDKGKRYVISQTGTGYSYRPGDVTYVPGYARGKPFNAVGIREMPQDYAYQEEGFEPITENQVRALEAIATDVPDEVRRELEEA